MQPPDHPATDLVLIALALAVAAVLFAGAAGLPPARWEPLGPAAVPRVLGALLVAFALVIGIGAIRRSREHAEAAPIFGAPAPLLRGGGVLAAMIVFIAAMDRLEASFVVAGPVFVAAVSLVVGGWSWRQLIAAAIWGVALCAALSLTFTRLFYINLA